MEQDKPITQQLSVTGPKVLKITVDVHALRGGGGTPNPKVSIPLNS